MQKPQEFLPEVGKPITMTINEIKHDMNLYVKNFPNEIIPHITEAHEINDIIHNYRQPKPSHSKANNKAI